MVDYKSIGELMQRDGLYDMKAEPPSIKIADSENVLRSGLKYFLGDDYKWPKFAFNGRAYEPYREVSEWMADNNHKGLTLLGACGQGKTVIARQIMPILINAYCKCNLHCFDAVYMAKKPDEVLKYHWLMLDDIGTEQETVDYGSRRQAFAEIVDDAEKHGKLLIVTTNLSKPQLDKKYGERVTDRLLSLTKGVVFKGKSMRK